MIYAEVLNPISGQWFVCAIENHQARTLTKSEAETAVKLINSAPKLAEQVLALQAFKDFVHGYLTGINVPLEIPESHHTKAGCRIGGRLDWVRDHMMPNALMTKVEVIEVNGVLFDKPFLEVLVKLINKAAADGKDLT